MSLFRNGEIPRCAGDDGVRGAVLCSLLSVIQDPQDLLGNHGRCIWPGRFAAPVASRCISVGLESKPRNVVSSRLALKLRLRDVNRRTGVLERHGIDRPW